MVQHFDIGFFVGIIQGPHALVLDNAYQTEF